MPASTPRRCGSGASCFRPSAPRLAGSIYVAYLRVVQSVGRALRELDGIASVIIGGGSIFGGYGTIIGSLAGRPRSRSSAPCCRSRSSCPTAPPCLPQHWVNVFIGLILIVRGARRHLAAPGGILLGRISPTPSRDQESQRMTTTPHHRDARHPEELRRGPRAGRRELASRCRARSWAWSATTRPASRR